jgi:hypothetical protein
LSLYRPTKGNDYKFFDRTASEMFQTGGTDVFVYKYLGPKTAENAQQTDESQFDPFKIQDILFLENRDRKYSQDVYVLRGVYNVSDIDFNLSQFGLFLQNDTVFITFHINDTVEKLGRKLLSGDVIELPHLRDDHAFNDLKFSLKRFYVIEDVNRAAEGFSTLWYPHLYRAKCIPLVDSQEFKDILDGLADKENFQGAWNPVITYYPGDIVQGADGLNYNVIGEVSGIAPPNMEYYELAETLRDIASTYEREMQITAGVLDLANADVPLSGYDTSKFYTLQRNEQGQVELINIPVENDSTIADMIQTASVKGYQGYITQDGLPPNGIPFTTGIAFPATVVDGQFHLRTDLFPNRLFQYNKNRWVRFEDNLRMTMTNLGQEDVAAGQIFEGQDVRLTQKTSFVNNTNVAVIGGKTVQERQSLSKALRPEADEF